MNSPVASVRGFLKDAVERAASIAPKRTVSEGCLVLAYHNVVLPGEPAGGDGSLHLAFDAFERQLRVIGEEADLVPLSDLFNRHHSGRRRVCVTFDDAYQSALALALPLLGSVGATVFVAPSLLGRVPPWDWRATRGHWGPEDRERFLWIEGGIDGGIDVGNETPDELAALRLASEEELMASLLGTAHTVGNHTMDHPNLATLSTEHASAQLIAATGWLRSRFGSAAVPYVAYPYGLAPRDPAGVLAASGLDAGFLVSGGWMPNATITQRSGLPRWNVPAGMSDRGFRARLRGWLRS